MREAVDEQPLKHTLEGEGVSLPFDTADYTKSGVFGKSSTASAEKGKKVMEAVVNELVNHVKVLKKARIEDLIQKPKV
jgi:creatinine amidohydrolase/Fe(II)-dependent formamide hydrolase-like protein